VIGGPVRRDLIAGSATRKKGSLPRGELGCKPVQQPVQAVPSESEAGFPVSAIQPTQFCCARNSHSPSLEAPGEGFGEPQDSSATKAVIAAAVLWPEMVRPGSRVCERLPSQKSPKPVIVIFTSCRPWPITKVMADSVTRIDKRANQAQTALRIVR
jgi:hypothetical protein